VRNVLKNHYIGGKRMERTNINHSTSVNDPDKVINLLWWVVTTFSIGFLIGLVAGIKLTQMGWG
jgi:hypothetical protein